LFDNDSLLVSKENKGFYRNYCVEINIHNIAVNSILQGSLLYDFEKLDFSSNKRDLVDLNLSFAETKGSEFDTPEKCT